MSHVPDLHPAVVPPTATAAEHPGGVEAPAAATGAEEHPAEARPTALHVEPHGDPGKIHRVFTRQFQTS